MIEAAGIPETFFTVWTNVFDRAGLKPGETILVHGGSSGIGTTAIMLAKAFGARVFATAGSPRNARPAWRWAPIVAINYRNEDFVKAVKDATEGKGADVILDMVGGDYIARNLAAAAMHGRIVNIAFLKGSKVEVDFLPIMLKRLTLTGSTLAAAQRRRKGGDRPVARGQGLAAVRRGQDQAADLSRLSRWPRRPRPMR